MRFIPTPRPNPEHNPFAVGAKLAAGGIATVRQQQVAGATPRYRHHLGSNPPGVMYMGQQIPGVPCIIPRPTAAPGHRYSAFAVVIPGSGVHRLYGQAVNIKTEQSSEINLEHKNATAFIEIKLTIRWSLLGFKEKDAAVINGIIKAFRAQDTIETGLSAVAAYLKGVFVQNTRAQDYSLQ